MFRDPSATWVEEWILARVQVSRAAVNGLICILAAPGRCLNRSSVAQEGAEENIKAPCL